MFFKGLNTSIPDSTVNISQALDVTFWHDLLNNVILSNMGNKWKIYKERWQNVCSSFFHYSLPKVFSNLDSATFDLFHWDWKAWVKAPKVVLTFSKVFLHFFWESNNKVMMVWKLTFGYPIFQRGLWWDCKDMQTIWSCFIIPICTWFLKNQV